MRVGGAGAWVRVLGGGLQVGVRTVAQRGKGKVVIGGESSRSPLHIFIYELALSLSMTNESEI